MNYAALMHVLYGRHTNAHVNLSAVMAPAEMDSHSSPHMPHLLSHAVDICTVQILFHH